MHVPQPDPEVIAAAAAAAAGQATSDGHSARPLEETPSAAREEWANDPVLPAGQV